MAMAQPAKPVSNPRRKKKTTFRRILGNVFYILFLGALAFSGAMYGWLSQSKIITNLIGQKLSNTKPQQVFSDSLDGGDSLTILILGCDSDYSGKRRVSNSHARSDMMMVARLDFNRKIVGAVSIPRDTQCQLPGYRRQRINAYHAIGGPDLAKRAVEHLLPGVEIDRVAVLNFDALVEIVDMLGGIEMYIPKDMDYDDNAAGLHIHLKKGRQTLDGKDALGFVRFRKGKRGQGDSDLERQKRQKDLMLALREKMVDNWTQGPKVLQKTIELGGNAFDDEEMGSLFLFISSTDPEKVRMGQVPVLDIPGTFELAVDTYNLRDTLREFHVVPPTDKVAHNGSFGR